MPAGVDVAIWVDHESVDRMLGAVDDTLAGPRLLEFLRDTMMPFLRLRAKARFGSEGDDASGPWLPLAESTERIRAEQGFPASHPINKRTGELENFITRGAFEATLTPHAASVFYPGRPSNPILKRKVETAQKGRDKPSTPARPVVAVNQADMNFMIRAFGLWFTENVRRRFVNG